MMATPRAHSHSTSLYVYIHLLKPSLNKRAALNSIEHRAIHNTPGKNRNGFPIQRPSPFSQLGVASFHINMADLI